MKSLRALGLSFFTLAAVACLGIAAWSLTQGNVASAQPQQVAEQPEWAKEGKRIALTVAEARKAAAAHLMPEGARSLLASGAMSYGDYTWDDEGVPAGKLTVWVDLRRQMVSAYRGGHEIGTAVMLYGKPDKETPRGTFPVLRKVKDYHSRTYDAPMPYSLFITNDGVALHGSDVRFGRATHGCVGLPIEFARLLFDEAGVGDEVTVVISDAGATEKLAQGASLTAR